MNALKAVCSVFLPKDTLKKFRILTVEENDDEIEITLQERNKPPIKGAKPRGFKEISIADFPIRNKKAILRYRRRYWKIKGQEGLITSDTPVAHNGTKLEPAFAEVLKKRS